MSAAAGYLGLTRAQLFKQLNSGKSLAQVAAAQHKTTSGLEQALLSQARSRLDKAVASKELTSAQEQQILSKLSARIDRLVNATPSTRPSGQPPEPPPGGLFFGQRRFGGPAGTAVSPTPPAPIGAPGAAPSQAPAPGPTY